MRVAFVDAAIEALDTRDDAVVVLADISTVAFAGVPNRLRDRVINVGIREQALVGVAGGLALAGMVPIVHTYATFLIERAFEQIKLDLSHQDVPAVLVSIGASYDEPAYGRTHHAPGDVALLSTLGDWHIEVPSAAADVRPLLLDAVDRRARTYLRLSAQTAAPSTGGLAVVRRGRDAVVLAVGPLLDRVCAAVDDLDVTVLHVRTVRPLDAAALAAETDRVLAAGSDSAATVVLVEPYLAGTAAAQINDALGHRAHRLFSHGVRQAELHRFGTVADHDRAHGLDTDSLRSAITAQVHRAGCVAHPVDQSQEPAE
ncbi:transketolase family protein [Jatrophihabitans lederbergiae]|uniref:Transketolase n=1 Tax=Jatrophihabitans lederbergiae TaxID=3075547 RepID=A0ABU2JAP5_9ACTN|nr:transketolase [Jatrophihabitans sp. DSM 44399]MDT0262055.1 transketolase [Jatrophihabitans sp. DSM 44399]